MRKVEEILSSKPVGNASGDYNLWKELYALALHNGNTTEVRARAIRKMDQLTGVNECGNRGDQKLVDDFVLMAIEYGLEPTFGDPHE